MWEKRFSARIGWLFLCGMLLTACVTTSPDVLLSTAPVGQATNTGQYPIIGQVPSGQTTQITPTEKTAIKTDLNRSVQKGNAQAAQDSLSDYNNEVAAMRKLAADEKLKRLKAIESRKF